MPIIPLICPNCAGHLTVDSDKRSFRCCFCGTEFITEKAIVQNYIQNHVNITADTVNVFNQRDFVIEGGVLRKYQGESMDIAIPNNVVEIGPEAFKGLRIRSVTIPFGVTVIGDSAFNNCTDLTSVIIPGSVNKIGHFVFSNCTGLTSVTITGRVTEVGYAAFSGCTRLASVTIPDSVKRIDDYAFSNCTGLTSVTIPGNTEIGKYAFSNCTGLASVTIPCSTSIGAYAFSGCARLTSVTIPGSVHSIGAHAFADCAGLQSAKICYGVDWIGEYAFSGCSALSSLTLPDSIGSINYAFSGCAKLNTLWISSKSRNRLESHLPSAQFIKPLPLEEQGLSLAQQNQRKKWREEGKCIYCGGEFVSMGFFKPERCRFCHRERDYFGPA